jgi:hypothetical protein
MNITVKQIPGYISYFDCQTFLSYLKEFGAGEVVEAHGGTDFRAPTQERIGAVVRSVKDFHASRYAGEYFEEHGRYIEQKLSQIEVVFTSNGNLEIPADATWGCAFYFSQLGDDYQGDPDVFGTLEVTPKWGDIVIFSTKEAHIVGKISGGASPRLYAFWKESSEV